MTKEKIKGTIYVIVALIGALITTWFFGGFGSW